MKKTITHIVTLENIDRFINGEISEKEIREMRYEEVREYPFDFSDLPEYDTDLKNAGFFLCRDRNGEKTIVGIDDGNVLIENTKAAIERKIINFDGLTDDIVLEIENAAVKGKFATMSDETLKSYIRYNVENNPQKLIEDLKDLQDVWELNDFPFEDLKEAIMWENYKLAEIQYSYEFQKAINPTPDEVAKYYSLKECISDKVSEIVGYTQNSFRNIENKISAESWVPDSIEKILKNRGYTMLAQIEEIEGIEEE